MRIHTERTYFSRAIIECQSLIHITLTDRFHLYNINSKKTAMNVCKIFAKTLNKILSFSQVVSVVEPYNKSQGYMEEYSVT